MDGRKKRVDLAFDELSVRMKTTDVRTSTVSNNIWNTFKQHVACVFTGTFLNLRKDTSVEVDALCRLSGYIPSGSSTLVLGPSSSGKTTFLKALGGSIEKNKQTTLAGKRVYGGIDSKQIDLKKVCCFVDNHSIHYPYMTVRDTLKIAFQFSREKQKVNDTKGPRIISIRINSLEEGHGVERKSKKLSTPSITHFGKVESEIIRSLHLEKVLDKFVGNEFIKGINDDERNRLTLAENLFMKYAVVLIDEIKTGFDSKKEISLYKLICSRKWSKHSTVIAAMSEPSRELISFFDKVLLLCEGRVIFHGPEKQSKDYFESIGYLCPDSMSTGKFLFAMTTLDREKYKSKSYAPSNAQELAKAWAASEFCTTEKLEVASALLDSLENEDIEKTKTCQRKQSNMFSYIPELRVFLNREMLLWKRKKLPLLSMFLYVILGMVFIGLLYLDIPTAEESATDIYWFIGRINACFLLVTFLSTTSILNMRDITTQLDVFHHHHKSNAHGMLTYIMGTLISAILRSFAESLLVLVGALMVNIIDNDAPDFTHVIWTFFAYTFVLNLLFQQIAKVCASLTETKDSALLLYVFVLAVMFCFCGLAVSPQSAPDFYIWVYWINPLFMALQGILVLVFNSESFLMNQSLSLLSGFGYQTDYQYVCIGILYCFIFHCLLIVVQVLVLCHTTRQKKQMQIQSRSYKRPDSEVELIQPLTSKPSEAANKSESFSPVVLTFKKLCYKVPEQNNVTVMNTVLSNVTGYIFPGKKTAIIGPENCGKSQLLQLLSYSKSVGQIEGEIIANGIKISAENRASFIKYIGYIPKICTASLCTTIHEALQFSSYLHRSRMTKEQRENEIEETARMLGLDDIGVKKMCSDLSPCEIMLVNIAVEMVAGASILLIEEPVCNMDLEATNIVFNAINKVSRSGRAIMCTINETANIDTFDDLMVLGRGGVLCYLGPTKEAITYFETFNSLASFEGNATTFILETLSNVDAQNSKLSSLDCDTKSNKTELTFAVTENIDFEGHFKRSICWSDCVNLIESVRTEHVLQKDFFMKNTLSKSIMTQMKPLMYRWIMIQWRLAVNLAILYIALTIGLVFGLMFLQNSNPNSIESVHSLIGVVSLHATVYGVVLSISKIQPYIKEREVLHREMCKGDYPLILYVFTSALSDIPYAVLAALLAFTPLYFIIGLPVGSLFSAFALFNMYTLVCIYFGHMIAAVSSHFSVGALSCISFHIWSFQCSGYMIGLNQIPFYFSWIPYISPLYYYNNVFFSAVFSSSCDTEQIGCALLKTSIFEKNSSDTSGIISVMEHIENTYGYTGTIATVDMVLALLGFSFFLKIMETLYLKSGVNYNDIKLQLCPIPISCKKLRKT